ncbi:MAG: hypothetical protein JST59_02850 [Actinobacteria bacterium]|nr:hypothetical protein [Actinomycetota bacterium]
MRKKYDAAKEKLKQANAKIMELLQFKIRTSNSPDSFKLPTLLSPAPTIKKVFNFTSEDKTLGSPQNLPARDSIAEDHRKQFLSPQNPSYAAGRT